MAVRQYAAFSLEVCTEPPWDQLNIKKDGEHMFNIKYGTSMSMARLWEMIRQKAHLPAHTPIKMEHMGVVSGRQDVGKAMARIYINPTRRCRLGVEVAWLGVVCTPPPQPRPFQHQSAFAGEVYINMSWP